MGKRDKKEHVAAGRPALVQTHYAKHVVTTQSGILKPIGGAFENCCYSLIPDRVQWRLESLLSRYSIQCELDLDTGTAIQLDWFRHRLGALCRVPDTNLEIAGDDVADTGLAVAAGLGKVGCFDTWI